MNAHWTDWLSFSQRSTRWAVGAVAVIVFLFGILWHHAGLLVVGAVALCFVLRRVSSNDANLDGGTTENRQPRRHHGRRAATKTTHESNGDSNGESDHAPRGLNRAV